MIRPKGDDVFDPKRWWRDILESVKSLTTVVDLLCFF